MPYPMVIISFSTALRIVRPVLLNPSAAESWRGYRNIKGYCLRSVAFMCLVA
jgi:hypothetical protein